MIVRIGGGEHRFFRAAEEALAQHLAGLERRQQLFAAIIGCRVRQQLGAVGHQRALQAFAVEPQATNQRVDRHQHRPGDIVGIDLVAGHQQGRRPLLRCLPRLAEQAIDANESVSGGVMRLAAGAVQQVVEARPYHE